MMRLKTVTRFSWVLVATVGAMLVMSAVAQASIGAPKLTAPRDHAVVESLPAFTWKPVRKAGAYQIEFSSTTSFASGVADMSAGAFTLNTNGYTNTASIPNGKYYWRVRAVSGAGVAGRWTRIQILTKRWTTAPKLISPVGGASVNWPGSPLKLEWRPVSYAVNYQVVIGTNPQLTTVAYGPVTVQGPDFVVPATLSPGTYYWSVRPIDSAGNMGTTSKVQSFNWSWATGTTVNESDVSPDPDYQEPSFSWSPIAGANSYEVQVATDPTYAANSIVIDQSNWTGTSYSARGFYPNHTTLYWRVRAEDSHGDAGTWTTGQSFTDVFDQQTPQNFHNVTASGSVDDGSTAPNPDPILRWSPVPGASHYNLVLAPWMSGQGCEFSQAEPTQTTTNTAWTPGGWPPGATSPTALSLLASYSNWEGNEYGWTGAALGGTDFLLPPGGAWCASLIAVRADGPLVGSTIESAPTILGSFTTPAFAYDPTAQSGPLASGTTVSGAEIQSPTYGSAPVAEGSTMSTTPLFEWNPVATADGYYVVVASDAQFDSNSIVTGGFTNTTAWAPPMPLQDQTGAYWWEVIPVNSTTGSGVPQTYGGATDGLYDPVDFNKNSSPPSAISPVANANASGMPVFSWHSAQGAQNYTLEISSDPTFASVIETDITDSTSFSTGATLPGDTPLYWRVRANDERYNLNWSPAQPFTHTLPVPVGESSPKTGSAIPQLSWTPVSGAISYNVKITSGGSSTTQSSSTAFLTPGEFFSPGATTWQVQSVFPGGGTSAFSPATTTTRTIPAPSGIHAHKSHGRILVTWKIDPVAKDYNVELSTSSEFSAPIVNTTTANTVWVPNITAAQAKAKLYWRIAAVDYQGTTGSYHKGVLR